MAFSTALATWWLCAVICSLTGVWSQSEMIAFPSGIRYPTVDPDNTRTPKDAYLFDATDVENKKLSLSFKVGQFKHGSQSQFRADPVLFTCIQKVQNAMQKENERVEIVSGYVPASSMTPTTTHDDYQSTGRAIRIRIKAGGSGTKTKNDLIIAAAKYCVPVLEQINRDIGITDLGDHIQIHIQGPDESGPFYSPATVATLAMTGIDQAYDVVGAALCPAAESPILSTAGDIFPDSVSTLQEAVGGLEEPISRDNVEDFGKLAHYPASHLVFQDTESSSSWCGKEGNPCSSCAAIVGFTPASTLNLRCADRTMTYRLMKFLRSLGKAVSLEWSGVKLQVLEAWDEPHSASPTGDQPEGSLHYEGRAAKVTTDDNDAGKLSRLSQLAICAGVDAALLQADHLVIAALKQKGTETRTVTFGDSQELVECEPPAANGHMYKLRDEFSETEAKEYPLFDSANRHDYKLGQEVTLGMFVPRDGRYLRLSPHIVSCFQSIVIAERKHGIDPPLQVCRSYYNQMEIDSEIDIFDKRYPSSGLGLSMELSFDCNSTSDHSSPLDLYDQMQMVIQQCAPIFYRADGKSMGIGLYSNFIAVDMRPTFKAWASHEDLLEGASAAEFQEYFQRWANRAIQGRIVDPDDPEQVCKTTTKPGRQDINFKHAFPEKTFIDNTDPNRCIPNSNTAFCTDTYSHRLKEVNRIFTEVKRKHVLRESGLKSALEACMKSCDACQQGEIWNIKVEGCNNFLHWVQFGFLNDYTEETPGDDVSLYLQESVDLKHYACHGHCLNKSPLFSLMVPSTEKRYRPNPDESIEERLYSTANNPLPVMELMHQIYAMSAKGIVKVWVTNEKELITLKDPLKHVCLYNKNITKVEIYVGQSSNKGTVSGVMQTFYAEWVKQGCPQNARKFLPPFTVADLPPHMSKRSAEFDMREQMLHHHRNWENRWLNGHPLI
ncbi:uncharacterized protein [Amphiura filiformis]|uniref:uncharacterized protein n=1 Tax=Amphiura filiformis TaxID=82378 RepID=UPI003B2150CC